MKLIPRVPGHFTIYEWLALGIWILIGAISHRNGGPEPVEGKVHES
jgi:hypothetical protein